MPATVEDVRNALLAIGMSESDVEGLPESDVETLAKAMPESFSPEDMQAVASDPEALNALQTGDAEAFSKAVKRAVRKPADEDEDDLDDYDEDEDEDEDEELDDVDEDEEEDEKDVKAAKKPRRTRKSLADLLSEGQRERERELEDDNPYVDAEELVKSLDTVLQERDAETGEHLTTLAKSVQRQGKKLDALLAQMEQLGVQPAGRALPYGVQKGLLDGGADAPGDDVVQTILKAQGAGLVDGTRACGLMKCARAGGEAWADVAEDVDKLTKDLADQES